jgi:hydrogenase-4 component E
MVDFILILVVLTNFWLLGTSRLGSSIRVVALQGILLGLLPLAAHLHATPMRVMALAAGSILLKGMVFPRLLFRAIREADVMREVEPFVGYVLSLLIGVMALGLSFWMGGRLRMESPVVSAMILPVAFFSIMAGFFLIVARKRAVHQVLGFLIFENGVYTFGIGAMQEATLLVELGILLDVFVGVFVMGIAIFHISREFDHTETDRLSSLKD